MSVHHPHPLSSDELGAADAVMAELLAEDDATFDALVRDALAARADEDAPALPYLALAA